MKEEHHHDTPHVSGVGEAADKLIGDFRTVLSHIEDLVGAGASVSGETAAQARDKLMAQFQHLRERVSEAEALAVGQGKEAAAAADRYVHESPWKAIALALVAGLVVGLIGGARRD